MPENAPQLVAEFRATIAVTTANHRPLFLMNIDETFVLFDMVPHYTYAPKGSRHVDIRSSRGNARLGFTVTLGITSDGRKLKAHITFKRPPAYALQEIEDMNQDNVVVSTSINSIMKIMNTESKPMFEKQPCIVQL